MTPLSKLENIDSLVELLAGKVEALLDEREDMLAEITRLQNRLLARDKEAVKTSQDMRSELEFTQKEVLRFEQERLKIETRLQSMNDRLIALAQTRRGG